MGKQAPQEVGRRGRGCGHRVVAEEGRSEVCPGSGSVRNEYMRCVYECV